MWSGDIVTCESTDSQEIVLIAGGSSRAFFILIYRRSIYLYSVGLTAVLRNYRIVMLHTENAFIRNVYYNEHPI